MPDVKGLSLMDAMPILENLGLQVQFIGEGNQVVKQSISKGENIKDKKQVKLILG